MPHFSRFGLALLLLAGLTNCSNKIEKDSSNFPVEVQVQREQRAGKVTGEEGLTLFGGSSGRKREKQLADSAIAVNNYLWRATLDTVSFMPLTSTDPFGGVIITDWHENTDSPGERFKLTAVILSRTLRADGVRVTVFRQLKDSKGNWQDAPVAESMNNDFENIILTRAKELRARNG